MLPHTQSTLKPQPLLFILIVYHLVIASRAAVRGVAIYAFTYGEQ